MEKINVLITGAKSQMALTLKELIGQNSTSPQYYFKNRQQLDITVEGSINKALKERSYDYCINCAAYTDVEGAESNEKAAFEVNSEGVAKLARACDEIGIVLIHISTDYVFDGRSKTSYTEESATNPINVYGLSKLSGEEHIRKIMKDYFIIRTSWLYSSYGKNFLKTIVRNIHNGKPMSIITSQIGTPTSCIDLGNFILNLIETKSKHYGTFHFSAKGETTWFGFSRRIAANFNTFDIGNIKPIDDYPTQAQRPAYSVLDNTKVSKLFELNDWRKSVDFICAKIKSQSNPEY